MTVRDIQRAVELLAPSSLAESWDNVGLLVGDPAQPVRTVLVALDTSADVLAQAAAHDAELLVVHHPLIFSGLKRLVEDGGISTLLCRLIREGRSLLAAHTNLDSAPEGLNQYVAALLGLQAPRPLLPSAARPLLKLVVYVPVSHVDSVRAAICAAGAGQMGRYADCTFGVEGAGTFRPGEGTHPYIGETGMLERVREVRLETVAPRQALGAVISALLASHPYEEVAYDLFPMENPWPGAGLGRIGALESPTTAGDFCARVRELLQIEHPLLIGAADRPVYTVALCTGAGGEFVEQAARAGADLYLTAKVKHHQALLARDQGMAVIDAGHFATERPAVELLAGWLERETPGVTLIRAEETAPFRNI